jgi:hypothetical protein
MCHANVTCCCSFLPPAMLTRALLPSTVPRALRYREVPFTSSLPPHVGTVSGRHRTFHHGVEAVGVVYTRCYLVPAQLCSLILSPKLSQNVCYNTMTSSTITHSAGKTSLRPVTNTMPRRVSFGAMPTPERPPDSRTASKKSSRTSLKASELHCMLFRNIAVNPMTDFKVDKTKSLSAQDKECEAQMAKLYKEKSKKGLSGMMNWVQDKVKGGDMKD